LVQALLDLYTRCEALTEERLRLYTDYHARCSDLLTLRADMAILAQRADMVILAQRADMVILAQRADMAILAQRRLEEEKLIARVKNGIRIVLSRLGLLYWATKTWKGVKDLVRQLLFNPRPTLPPKPQLMVKCGTPIPLASGVNCNGPLLIAVEDDALGNSMAKAANLSQNDLIRTTAGDGLLSTERTALQHPSAGSLMAWLISPDAIVLHKVGTIVIDATDDIILTLLRGRIATAQALLLCGRRPDTALVKSLGAPTCDLGELSLFSELPVVWQDLLDENLAPRPEIVAARHWPKISVVMVSYNQGEFLEEGMLSVLNQGYPNLEILVVDALSTDGSVDILERYRDRLDLLIIEKDHGQSDGLNKGFRRATGQILTWVNSDDLLEPGALFRVAQAFTEYKEVDMVIGGCRQIGTTRATVLNNHHCRLPIGRPTSLPLDKLLDIYNYWLKGAFFYQPEVFFSRDLWVRSGAALRLDLNYVLDYDLWVRMAAAKAQCVHIPEFLACSRTHENQKTTYGKMPYLPEMEKLLVEYHDTLRPMRFKIASDSGATL
ncbi:MAG: glycosyltransferase family 2 protein, partial [Rhodospirillaceae bacterium]